MAKTVTLPPGWYDPHAARYGEEVASAHNLLGVDWRSDRPSACTLHVHEDSRGRWRWSAVCGDGLPFIVESGWEDSAIEAMRAADRWADRLGGRTKR